MKKVKKIIFKIATVNFASFRIRRSYDFKSFVEFAYMQPLLKVTLYKNQLVKILEILRND